MSGPDAQGRLVTWCFGRMRPTGEVRAVGCAAPTGTAARNQAGRRPHVGGCAVLPRGPASTAVREAAWCPRAAFCSGPPGRASSGSGARAKASARRIRTTDTRRSACYHVSVNDTSSDAARVQALVHRRMGGPRKLVMACQMSDAVRAMASARIRSRHPELNEREIRDELVWELYGVRRGR